MKNDKENSALNIYSEKAIVDYRTDNVTIGELKRLGFDVIKTKPIPSLYREVMGHTDMQLHIVNGKVICEPSVYSYYKSIFNDAVCGSISLKSEYPYDIAYNTCKIGKYAVCRVSHTAIEILAEYRSLKMKILNANQGYAKCSICVVNDESAITADSGMYKLLKENNLNVLKINSGYVQLYGMQGLIGGASGLIRNDLLAFNGEIKTHPDCSNIIDFCKNVGVDVISLNNGALTDIGSILIKKCL